MGIVQERLAAAEKKTVEEVQRIWRVAGFLQKPGHFHGARGHRFGLMTGGGASSPCIQTLEAAFV